MWRGFMSIVLALAAASWFFGWACADEPVKWSAPVSAYPNPWTPTTPPAAFHNQYANQYPRWAGYQPYAGNAPSWQPARAPGFSGNPYMRHYAP
jgi:hypothetical protein